MKKGILSFLQVIVLTITIPCFIASAYAQSPREELKQMVEQLQRTPNDNALREKIIKLAASVKPAPAVPDAAIAFEGRAQFAFKSAKSEGDYLAAAQEYEKAVAAAPWVLGYYTDLCTIYEKAGKFEDAKRHCGFYLIGLTDPAQMTEVKRRIAGLEFGIEKANTPQAREAALLEKVEGARFMDVAERYYENSSSEEMIYEIKDGVMYKSIRIYSMGTGDRRKLSMYGHDQPGLYPLERTSYRDGAFTITSYGNTCVYRIRPDGQALLMQCGRKDGLDEVIPRQ